MPITQENSQLIESMYLTLVLESHMAARGGNKRGFLQAEKRLEQGQINDLRTKFQSMYSNADKEPFVVLNQGLSFKEISDTAVEMQLNENKETNAVEAVPRLSGGPERQIRRGCSRRPCKDGCHSADDRHSVRTEPGHAAGIRKTR